MKEQTTNYWKKNESKMNTKQNKKDIIFSGPTEVTQHDPPELLV